MPRFAILEHDWPARHWDFLLEAGGVLRAWRLLQMPEEGKTIPAEANFDHRLIYLEYEGPLSGDRGRVVRWDAGAFEWVVNEPDSVVVNLAGGKLSVRFELKRTATGWTANFVAGNSSNPLSTDASENRY